MVEKTAEPVASVEHIPAGEHGRDFPPFDATTFASQLFWLALTFIALYLIMARAALPRIRSILENRRGHVEGLLGGAQRLKQDSDALMAAHQEVLTTARARAQGLANEGRQNAEAEAAAKRKEVDLKLNTRVANAEKSISASRSEAMGNLRLIASEAAGAIVQRLTGVEPNPAEVSEAVGKVMEDVRS